MEDITFMLYAREKESMAIGASADFLLSNNNKEEAEEQRGQQTQQHQQQAQGGEGQFYLQFEHTVSRALLNELIAEIHNDKRLGLSG